MITGERKDVGQRRRQLGSMYGPNDTKARIPPEYQRNRQRGIVVDYQQDKLYGFIANVDAPDKTSLFVHCDDCHIAGKRLLRKGQLVEYVAVSDEESQRTKALHVSGINQTVLHSISDNHYLPRDLTTMEYEVDGGETRHRGTILSIDRNNRAFFSIKPCDRGYEPVFGLRSNVNSLGRRALELGMAVEFSVAPFIRKEDNDNANENDNNNNNANESENDQNKRKQSSMQAVNVTAEGGFPMLTQRGQYGRYLQSKINLSTIQGDMELAPLTQDNTLEGYVATYSRQRQFGTIEIEAPDGVRYQKVKFLLSDCVLPDNVDAEKAHIGGGMVVKCNITEAGEPTEDEKDIASRGGLLLERQATNITSVDSDYLQCREIRQEVDESSSLNQSQQQQQQPLRNKTMQGMQQARRQTSFQDVTEVEDDLGTDSRKSRDSVDDSWESKDEKTITL